MLAYLVVFSFLNPINVCGVGFSNAVFFTLLYALHLLVLVFKGTVT
jgi:hypothetical protein